MTLASQLGKTSLQKPMLRGCDPVKGVREVIPMGARNETHSQEKDSQMKGPSRHKGRGIITELQENHGV